MRYLYYIVAILLVLSAIIAYQLSTPAAPKQKAALIINEKVITTDEFARLFESRQARGEGKRDFINSLITRELLIQASRKEGIDREEPFRKSIQNFYEQSLIKLLMDRKFSSLAISVTDEELSRRVGLVRKKIHLTIFSFTDPESAEKGVFQNGETTTGCFEDLCRDIQAAVAGLEPGQKSNPLMVGGRYLVVRLDNAVDATSCAPRSVDRERLRRALIEEKKEKVINDWAADLRKKAFIKILINES